MEALRGSDPDRLGGYRLLGRLGEGGMGVVYLGRSRSGRAVAVKVIRERFAADPHFRARFRREATAAATVDGAVTAPVLDADPEATQPWLVTAYLAGVSLREAVGGYGPLPPAALGVLAHGLAEALVSIHRAGITHRDLKPGNVLLTRSGARVIDFGIARPEDATTITRLGTMVGTPGYMSPEQVAGEPVGPPTDVFAAGSVLAYAATGRAPFAAADSGAVLQRVLHAQADLTGLGEPWLYAVVLACLHADPWRRPTAAALLGLLADTPGTVGTSAPPGLPGQPGHWLPPALAEDIDRRGALAAASPPVTARSARPAAMGEPTADPGTGRTPARPGRRALLIGAGALAVAAVPTAILLGRNASGASAGAAAPPVTTRRPAPPSRPPTPSVRWETKVSDYYPDLYAGRGVVLVKTQEDRLCGLDPRTGRPLWKKEVTLFGSISAGHVFTAGNINTVIREIDPRSGATRWAFRPPPGPTGSPYLPEFYLKAAQVGSLACLGGQDVLRALDDGVSRWFAPVDSTRGLLGCGDTVVSASERGLVGTAAADGSRRWSHPGEALYLAAGPQEVLFVNTDRDLIAYRGRTGAVAWRATGLSVASTPVVAGRSVYLGGGRGEALAVDRGTGRRQWSRGFDHDCVLGCADGLVYVAAGESVHCLDAADGSPRWSYAVDATRDTPPAAADGQVYVGTRAGTVRALVPPQGGADAGP